MLRCFPWPRLHEISGVSPLILEEKSDASRNQHPEPEHPKPHLKQEPETQQVKP